MTEANQADLFPGRAPVDEGLTPARRMRMIRRRGLLRSAARDVEIKNGY
jgi:hypothetical protein